MTWKKVIKLTVALKDLKKSVCVTPHPSLRTPPPYNNKQDYKGDTQKKILDSDTRVSNLLKKEDAGLKRNLEKEIKNAEDDGYIDYPTLSD